MKKIIPIILLAWIILIFSFSQESSKESNHTSDKITIMMIKLDDRLTGKTTSDKMIKKIVLDRRFIVRKVAHVTEYFILTIIILCTYKIYLRKKIFLKSFITSLFLASIDEFHQLFISGRTGQVKDILIDSIGITLGLIVFYIFNIIIKKVKFAKQG